MSRPSKPDPERRSPLNRERVLRAAVKLADEGGIDSLSMRELGRRLGVEAMSLYNHVANKSDILDGMIDLVVSEIDLPSGIVDWKTAMRQRAVSAREAFARHPWAPALIDTRTTSGPARLRYFDWMIGTFRRAGFSLQATARALVIVDSYIYGFERQQFDLSAGGEYDPKEAALEFMRAVPAGEYPYLTEMIAGYAQQSGNDPQADFEFGLDLILDGLELLAR